MWNEKDGYINKKDLEICKKYAIKVNIKILKIYNDPNGGYNRYYMYYTIDKKEVYKSEIEYKTYKELKDKGVLTSQKLSRIRDK